MSGWDGLQSQDTSRNYSVPSFPFIDLGAAESNCGSKVSFLRMQHNDPGHGLNPDCFLWSLEHFTVKCKHYSNSRGSKHLLNSVIFSSQSESSSLNESRASAQRFCRTGFLYSSELTICKVNEQGGSMILYKALPSQSPLV